MTDDPNKRLETSIAHGHEEEDIDLKVVGRWTAILFALMFATVFGMKFLFGFKLSDHYLVDSVPKPRLQNFQVSDRFAPPRLQNNPRRDWSEYSATEQKQLDSYGWTDKNVGVARIPVDKAMDLLLEKGLPVRK